MLPRVDNLTIPEPSEVPARILVPLQRGQHVGGVLPPLFTLVPRRALPQAPVQ